MVNYSDAYKISFNNVMNFSRPVRLQYFTVSGASTGYDDDVTYSKSGADVWVSGVTQPVRNTFGSNDAVLLAQGKIFLNDKKVYLKSDVNTSGVIQLGIGSPNIIEYKLTDAGVKAWDINGTTIYKLAYVRALNAGSFIGE